MDLRECDGPRTKTQLGDRIHTSLAIRVAITLSRAATRRVPAARAALAVSAGALGAEAGNGAARRQSDEKLPQVVAAHDDGRREEEEDTALLHDLTIFRADGGNVGGEEKPARQARARSTRERIWSARRANKVAAALEGGEGGRGRGEISGQAANGAPLYSLALAPHAHSIEYDEARGKDDLEGEEVLNPRLRRGRVLRGDEEAPARKVSKARAAGAEGDGQLEVGRDCARRTNVDRKSVV